MRTPMAVRGPASLPAGSGGPMAIMGVMVLTAALAGCGEAAAGVDETLTAACVDARDHLAEAPAPADEASDLAFMEAADEAGQTVASAADDLTGRGDDHSIADLAGYVRQLPGGGDAGNLPRAAYEASAAISRIDDLAEVLVVPECGAATWRPADWRAMAARTGDPPDEGGFRSRLDGLCADTFPNPTLLADGTPLLQALVTGSGGGEDLRDPSEVKAEVLARLNTVSVQPSAAARFIRSFSNELPALQPSEGLEDEYVALLAAVMHLDTAVPNVVPRDPSQDVRDRVYTALTDFEDAWRALDITC